MDPNLYSLAYRLRAEMLAEAAQQQRPRPKNIKILLHWLGRLLIMLGQKL